VPNLNSELFVQGVFLLKPFLGAFSYVPKITKNEKIPNKLHWDVKKAEFKVG
jgi:hypothetical protein